MGETPSSAVEAPGWGPLGDRPVSAVLLPSLVTTCAFVASSALAYEMSVWHLLGPGILSASMLVWLFAVAERHGDLTRWLVFAMVGLVLGEIFFRSIRAEVTGPSCALAALLYLTFGRGGGIGSSGESWRLQLFAVVVSAVSCATLLFSAAASGVMVGFTLTVVVLCANSGRVAAVAEGSLPALGAVMGAAALAVATASEFAAAVLVKSGLLMPDQADVPIRLLSGLRTVMVGGVVAATSVGILVVLRGRRGAVRPVAASGSVPGAGNVSKTALETLSRVLASADRVFNSGLDRLAVKWAQLVGPAGRAERSASRTGDSGPPVLDYLPPVALWLLCTGVVKAIAASSSLANGNLLTARAMWDSLRQPFDITGRVGWGTGDYWVVADHGYRLDEHREAIFPAVPLLLRTLHRWTGLDIDLLQTGVATVSGLACVVLFWAWMRQRGVVRRVRWWAVVLFLLFPWNFVLYGYGYADATLVALLLAVFLLAERGHPVFAGSVAAVAAATRPNGLSIIVVLLVFELARSGAVRQVAAPAGDRIRGFAARRTIVDLGAMGVGRWGVLLSASLITVYSGWMWKHAGSPVYWMTVQSWYGHPPVFHLAAWAEGLFDPAALAEVQHPLEAVNEVFTALVMVGSAAMIPSVWRRFGVAYGVFAALTWAMAWTGSRLFAPGGRLIMPMTPLLAVIAASWLIERRYLRFIVAAASALGSLSLIALFPRGGELWLGW